MTEQEKQKLKDALIEDKHIHPTEYDDKDAFVGICFSDLVDIINSVMNNTGWHPASELPPLDGKKNSKPVIAICGIPDPLNYGRVLPRFSAVVGGVWTDKDIKWWCYPPKED